MENMPHFKDPRFSRAVRDALRAGWRGRIGKKGVVLYPPDGSQPISVHNSNRGGGRQTPNAIIQLRRAGLEVADVS